MKVNRTAIVTESGNGLGRTFANILLKNNYDVILAASGSSYELLATETEELHDYKLIKTDFTSEEAVTALKDTVQKIFPHVNLLINNAEIANGFGQKIEQIDIEEVKELFETNVFAVMRLVKVMKPLMEKSENARIINITSALGDIDKMKDDNFCYANYCMTAYASSKAALNMYTHMQHKELRPSKISVESFDPVALHNCTHNSVSICNEILDEFVELVNY
jgi:NAD(P)-dependent dehydrogenase (short-subunit alcohol dehydrogenase family)